MPASMISDAVGGRWKVMGSSMAMVATGPMPGSTPIRVPTMQPIRQYSRFWRLTATLRPRYRLLRRSSSPDSLQDGDVHTQSDLENEDAEDGENDHVADDLGQLELIAAQRGDDDQRDQRRKQAETLEEKREGHDADGHQGDGTPLRRLDGLAASVQGDHANQRAQHEEDVGQHVRHIAGPHADRRPDREFLAIIKHK